MGFVLRILGELASSLSHEDTVRNKASLHMRSSSTSVLDAQPLALKYISVVYTSPRLWLFWYSSLNLLTWSRTNNYSLVISYYSVSSFHTDGQEKHTERISKSSNDFGTERSKLLKYKTKFRILKLCKIS